MKKLVLLCAAGIVALVLAACGSVPAQSPTQIAGAVQAQVVKACAVAQPTLLSVQAMTADDPAKQVALAQLVKGNAAVCSAGASIDTATLDGLVNTTIPAAIQVVGLLPIDPAAKTGAQIGLIAFQTALSAAIAQYGKPAAVAPAAASGAVPS